eukprot:TRINITY_DN787_c0_g1_i1.p1 TRINITY_DN787_c0_g1~~TRINITY_DN787_c0_g1_i1.p1  ORF type:complete len:279 (+),score=14.26 TRINITY_DN787_c0_g1_i1:159-995(+)
MTSINIEQLLNWPEEEVKLPLPKQVGVGIEEAIRNRLLPDTCHNFVVAFCCVLIVCAFAFHFSTLPNQLRPCHISEESPNPYAGYTLPQLKPLILSTNVSSYTINQLVLKLFDVTMDCIVAFDPRQENGDFFIYKEDLTSETDVITYYRDRLRVCVTSSKPCRNETVGLLTNQLNRHLWNDPLSYDSGGRKTVTDEYCETKTKEIETILKKITLFRPDRGCTMDQLYNWERLTHTLAAARDRLVFLTDRAEISTEDPKPYRPRVYDPIDPMERPRYHP